MPDMPRDNSTAAECARLRDCLQTLSASAGKTTVRVELELSGKGEQILIKVTAPARDDRGRDRKHGASQEAARPDAPKGFV